MRLTEEYQLDWKFYVTVLLIVAVVVTGFAIGRRMIIRATGRDVQKLIIRTNYGEIEASRKQARIYVRGLVDQYNLAPRERNKAEDIYTRFFHERMNIWIEDRIKGRSEAYTRRRQAECGQRYEEEFQQFLKERE